MPLYCLMNGFIYVCIVLGSNKLSYLEFEHSLSYILECFKLFSQVFSEKQGKIKIFKNTEGREFN